MPSSSSDQPKEPPRSLNSYHVGVFKVVFERPITRWSESLRVFQAPELFVIWRENRTYMVKFLTDVYFLAPILFPLYVCTHLLGGVDQALRLFFANELFRSLENWAKSGTMGSRDVVLALGLRVIAGMAYALRKWGDVNIGPLLKTKVAILCRQRVIRAHLRVDLLSANNTSDLPDGRLPQLVERAMVSIFSVVFILVSSVSQLYCAYSLMKAQENGLLLVLLCLVRPALSSTRDSGVLRYVAIVFVDNPIYRRMLSLYEAATNASHKQEVISGGLQNYISSEYDRAASQLGTTSDSLQQAFMGDQGSLPTHMLDVFLEELPLVFYVLQALRDPSTFSLASLATLQQLNMRLSSIFSELTMVTVINTDIMCLKSLYADYGADTRREGGKSYPPAESGASEGMGVELRNVTFKYPGSKDGQLALQNVSFTITPSSLVVIVGENGSGKSTIVKLLAQLYRPTEGTIIIDGADAQTFNLDDLYNATALLNQEHSIFPFSIAENIGIGDPADVDNMKKVHEAAKLGGAAGFIGKLPLGYEEVLHPMRTHRLTRQPPPDGPLKRFAQGIEQTKEISGGEKQRLAAARTFMRLMSSRTKLVIADEPTSAMDPSGEYELFERLRAMRAGKTMVFVTHRFGHLTKHADLVLCMKEGVLVESGTHKALMEMSGEYARLYEVQAKAFTEE